MRFYRVKGANVGTPRFGLVWARVSARTGRAVMTPDACRRARTPPSREECIDVLGLRLDVRAPYIDLAQHFDVLGAMHRHIPAGHRGTPADRHSRAVH